MEVLLHMLYQFHISVLGNLLVVKVKKQNQMKQKITFHTFTTRCTLTGFSSSELKKPMNNHKIIMEVSNFTCCTNYRRCNIATLLGSTRKIGKESSL